MVATYAYIQNIIFIHYVQSLAAVIKIAKFILHGIYQNMIKLIFSLI